MSQDMDQLLEEAIPLIAEDLRIARARLGITSARAAKRAGMSCSRYRLLESGRMRRSRQTFAAMISVAGHLGLESVRVSYMGSIDQHMRVGVARNEPVRIYFDTLDSNIAQLKEQSHFVSPHLLLNFVDRDGVGPIVNSTRRVDKLIVELWITAIFTLCLDGDHEHYIAASIDDPPDTEVLMVNKETGAFSMLRVEITRHGRHSKSVTDIIAKKLKKRYQDGTVLVVLVEESHGLHVADLYDFIQKNNPHRQRIFIIGRAEGTGKFKVIPWNEVSEPVPGEKAWMEIIVDTKDKNKGRCQYDGVVFKPPYTNRFRPVFPVFIKAVDLHR